jgi:hypothetical protein
MTTTIDAVRARLRVDLDDVDPTAYRWADAELERHINHALNRMSWEMPRELSSVLTTTAGSRDVWLIALETRIRVSRVEFPAGNYPPTYVRFSLWGDRLTLLVDNPPAVQDLVVYWLAAHVLDQSRSSLDGPLIDVLLDGAAAYAASQMASYVTERVSSGGPGADRDYAAFSTRKMRAFDHAIRYHGTHASLRPSMLYTPDEPAPTQNTDPGP